MNWPLVSKGLHKKCNRCNPWQGFTQGGSESHTVAGKAIF